MIMQFKDKDRGGGEKEREREKSGEVRERFAADAWW